MITVFLLVFVAAGLWFFLFSPWTAGWMNFWLGMAATAGSLALTALAIQRRELRARFRFQSRDLLLGVVAAGLLYGVFWLGDRVAAALFDFARSEVASIYARRSQLSPAAIGALLFFWIGPAEEIFWRGFVQTRLAARFGDLTGLALAALAYACVHLWAVNLMLFGAALIGGVFWGALYWRCRSLWPGIISHALWDVAIFVVWPIE